MWKAHVRITVCLINWTYKPHLVRQKKIRISIFIISLIHSFVLFVIYMGVKAWNKWFIIIIIISQPKNKYVNIIHVHVKILCKS